MRRISNVALFLLITIGLTVVQTTVWFQLLGPFPPPLLWLPPIVYLSLYRKPEEGVLVGYLILFALTTQTNLHLSVLLLSYLAVFVGTIIFKTRVFSPGSRYFFITNAAAALAFPICEYILSLIIEDQSIVSPEIGSWIVSAVLTPFAAVALYPLFSFIDKLTDKEQLIETRKEQIL